MGATIYTRVSHRRFLAVLMSAGILFGCAYKSGFNGEHMLSGGGGESVYCGDPASPAPKIDGRIGLFAGELGGSDLFENPLKMEDSIQSFGRCYFVPKNSWELPEGVTDLHLSRFLLTQHQPFGNVVTVNGKPYATDTTLCHRLEISVRVQSQEGLTTLTPVFNNRDPYFDVPVLGYFKDLCKAE